MKTDFRYVKNADELLHGHRELRLDALRILEGVLAEVNPYARSLALLRLEEDALIAGGRRHGLAPHERVWFIGAGKASFPIARAVEDVLGTRLAGGLVVCKGEQEHGLQRIAMLRADHPVPSAASVAGAKHALALCSGVAAGDIVISGITGGSSALLTLPCEGLQLEDVQELTKLLLTCGANIVEINAVRKHASQVGGGRLAMALDPRVRIINITASDVIGDALDYVTDPTVPDTSSVADARATLTRYALWDRVPARVASFFAEGGSVRETPKQLPHLIQNELLLSASSAADAARTAASQLGYSTLLLSSCFEGESSSLGHVFASIAREIVNREGPIRPPCAVIGGGETIVTMGAFGGRGGPNQEFALAGAMHLPDAQVVLLGVDTDGTDGPTDLAGGLCDSMIRQDAAARQIDVATALREHRASDALQALSDAVITGATGSNVNDLKLMLIR